MMRIFRPRSLRQKLTLVALVTIVAAQVCAGVVLIALERANARRHLVEALAISSRVVVDNTAAALSFADSEAAIDTLRGLAVHEGFQYACLYDARGALFAAHAVRGACRATPHPDGPTFDDGLLVSTPVMASRGRLGTLTIKTSLEPVNRQLRAQVLTILVVLLVSSIVAVVLVARLQTQLTAPLLHLAETAEAVSRDRNYSRRVRKETDDEVGAVSEAINDMLSQIQARDDELQHALRLKDEFLATVSHELRTPLNAMLGWSHVLRSPQSSPEMTQQAVAAIDRNARMQAKLIEDILDVSRIITGKLRLEPRPTDLVGIVASAVEVIRPSAQAKSIAIEVTLPPAAPFIGDPDRLRQVVWNLLSNAVKFTPQGGTVQVQLEAAPSEYRLDVTDSGRGLSPDFLPYIFQAFRQADGSPTRSQGGLGLGLAIARHLTELSGGSIQAASPGLGLGATFSIRLPRSAAFVPPPAEDVPPPPRLTPLDGHTVLVVDDNEDTRHVLTSMLESHGARVSTASSVAEARALLEQAVPDVLVTDLAMPVEDGFGLLHHCRYHGDPRLQALPILALTAYGGQQAQDRVLAAGFDAYLAKPVDPTEVGRIVKELCRHGGAKASSPGLLSTDS